MCPCPGVLTPLCPVPTALTDELACCGWVCPHRSEIHARTILFSMHPIVGALYFVSFMIVNAVVLTNVVGG